MARHTPTVYFTSDLHLGHPRVAEIRGFPSVEAHDEAVATRWRAAVHPEDRVYVLGDVTGDARALPMALPLLASLPGSKHLISGNHDACHPLNRRAYASQERYLSAFSSVASAARFRGYGVEALLSHFPYVRDREGRAPRYLQWRLPNLGEWLLHGHTHGPERVTVTEGSREIHVGVDAWDLTPVSVAQVAALMAATRPGSSSV